MPVEAGAGSLFAGSGAVAGAGPAGVVSVGFEVLAMGCSVVAVGAVSSFLAFFLPKRPLKAFFSWSIASGAVSGMSDMFAQRWTERAASKVFCRHIMCPHQARWPVEVQIKAASVKAVCTTMQLKDNRLATYELQAWLRVGINDRG